MVSAKLRRLFAPVIVVNVVKFLVKFISNAILLICCNKFLIHLFVQYNTKFVKRHVAVASEALDFKMASPFYRPIHTISTYH